MENNETYNWAPNDPGNKRNKPSLKKVGSKVLVFVLVMLLVGGVMSCFYTVCADR